MIISADANIGQNSSSIYDQSFQQLGIEGKTQISTKILQLAFIFNDETECFAH